MVYIPSDSSIRPIAIQVVVSMVANIGMMNTGMTSGFPSLLLPALLGSRTGLHTSLNQATWLGSMSFMSSLAACLLAGPLIDQVGRRWGLVLLNIIFVAGWIPSAFFPLSLPALYLGRVLAGIGSGMASAAAGAYTAEIATVQLRTILVSFNPAMLAFGVFLDYLWGMFYQESFIELSYFGFGLSLVSLVLTLLLLPESPVWLMSRGRAEEALQALLLLRGGQVGWELGSIGNVQRQTYSCRAILLTLRQPQAYKPLLIMNALFMLANLTGLSISITYAVDFIRSAGVEAGAYNLAMGTGVARIVSTFVTPWMCNRFGRRTPSLIFSAIMTAATALLTLSVSGRLPLPQWLAGVTLLVYVYSSCTSYSNMLWAMLGEVYPTEIRGFASGVTAGVGFVFFFLFTKIYPIFTKIFEPYVFFLFFTIFGTVGTLTFYLFLPETHGKTLSDIELYFQGIRKLELKIWP